MAITVTCTKGNGQLVPANQGMPSKDIVIQVLNGGAAVVGATVTITCTQGGNSVTPPIGYPGATVTDSSGNLTLRFLPGSIVTSQGYVLEYDFTATYSAVSATFQSIGYYTSPTLIPGVYAVRLLPASGALYPAYNAQVGVAGTPIKIQVLRNDTGFGVPNVGVKLIPVNDGTTGPQQVITVAEASGPEGLVFTASDGTATLTPTFSVPTASMSNAYEPFNIVIGTFTSFGPFNTNITVTPASVLPASGGSGSVSPGFGAHKTWRLKILAGGTSINELSFYDANNNPIATTGGTACAYTTAGYLGGTLPYGSTGKGTSSNDPVKSFDSDITTNWTALGSPPALPQWVEYNFSTATTVAGFFVAATQGADPSSIKVQYGDVTLTYDTVYGSGTYYDSNVDLTDATASTPAMFSGFASAGTPGWGFAIATPAPGYYLSYRIKTSSVGSGAALRIAEIAMYSTPGGTNLCLADGAQATASDASVYTTGPTKAFDGNTATYWESGNTASGWVSINFRVPRNVTQVTLTPVSTSLFAAPTKCTLEGSNDGGNTWTVLGTYSLSWPNANPQTLGVPTTSLSGPAPVLAGNTSSATARGNADYDQTGVDARHGSGTKLQMSDATHVFGHVPMFLPDGTLTDSGLSVPTIGTAASNPLTTRGDLFGFSTAAARIPVGTNGSVLLADSTTSLGVRWGAVADAFTVNGAAPNVTVSVNTVAVSYDSVVTVNGA